MKKIFLVLPFIVLNLNAEMMGEGDSGNFISDKERSEMTNLLSHDEETIDEKELIADAMINEVEVEDHSISLQNPVPMKENRVEYVLEDEEISDFDMDEPNLLPIKEVKKKKKKKKKTRKGKVEELENSDDIIGADDIQLNKVKLKQYNIKYDHSYDSLSYENVSKESFNAYLKKKGINQILFKKLLNSDRSIDTVNLSAFYYDYYLSRPDYAENFYKILYKNRKNLKIGNKFLLADYILRTGRGDKLHSIISKKECSSYNKKTRARCFYYLGLDRYFNTGNRKNKYMKMAKGASERAKIFYNGK